MEGSKGWSSLYLVSRFHLLIEGVGLIMILANK